MTALTWALLFFGLLAVLLVLRIHIGIALLVVSLVASMLLYGVAPGMTMAITAAFSSVSTFTLTAIPLFILMGELIFRTGLAYDAIAALDHGLRRLQGRLGYLSVLSGGLLGVLSGSAVASTGVLGGTLLPAMLERKYRPELAMGSILGAGGLAMVLPPSAVVIVLGATGGIPVGPLLMAGLVPGLVMLAGYLVVVTVQTYVRGMANENTTSGSALKTTAGRRGVLRNYSTATAIVGIAVATLALIVTGITTPSEAAGVSLLLTGIVAVAFHRMSFRAIRDSVQHTVITTGMIFILIIAAAVYAQVMSGTGIVRIVGDVLTNISDSPYLIVILMLAIVVLLGMFLESIALVLLTVPLFMPLLESYDIDYIWFGIMMVIALQIGTVTPPLGLSLFVIKSFMPGRTPMSSVYRAAVPFVVSDLIVILAVFLVPPLATWLPSLM